jgi:hypothetical protein
LFNIDEFLAARGLRVDEVSRIKLIEQVAIALVLGAETLKRRAHGDYGLDEVVKRFPPWKEKEVRSLNGSHTRLADLLKAGLRRVIQHNRRLTCGDRMSRASCPTLATTMRVRSSAAM